MNDSIPAAPSASTSDDALIHRLYDCTRDDASGELAAIDRMVYQRLAEAYGEAPAQTPADVHLRAA